MSAARPLPSFLVDHPITIDNTFIPDHKGIIVGHGDTVTFSNTSSRDIVITFLSNSPGMPVSSQNIAIPAGQNKVLTAPSYDCATNYTVNLGSVPQNGGPFAIQVGNGYMYVKITNNYSSPDPVAIPIGGRVEFYSTDNTYTVNWSNAPSSGGPFSSPLNQALPGAPNNTNRQENIGIVKDYNYSIPMLGPLAGQGGGKVIVVSG